MSLPTIDLAFLGCGNITRKHARLLKSFPAVRLYFASRDRAKAETFNRELGGAGAFGGYAEAIADPRVSTVMVATPPDSHLDLTTSALEGGKHAIVEKPAFHRSADFETVGAAERRSGKRAFVAENYAYKPLARVLREIVRSGDLGDIRFVHLVAVKQQRLFGWREDEVVTGGGALFEGGVHWVDLFANLGLTVESVRGFRPGEARGPERSMVVVAKYAEGAVGTLLHSWEVPSPFRGLRISRIFGTKGTVTFESNGLIVIQTGKRFRVSFPGLRDINGYAGMFRDFFDAIRTGREPVLTLARARQGLEIVETAYRGAAGTHTLKETR
ncbi:MAG TPA: Gfo/Idh/MocA family oxidoreductase [Gemmatimonadales bacterium]|nr:Gfo/Idh/MocA family oxidoreductase [Gemmatimonadales bacterium]